MPQTYYQKINSEWKKMTLRGITGKDVKVFVLDSGNNNSPDFSANITANAQVDVFGHGSLMGSIIKSSIGLANGCILYNVKVINDNGTIFVQNVIDGLSYALANGADVISMSFTVGSYNQGLQDKINACAAAGIVMLASAGNSFTLDYTLYPANALNVIAVNSVDSDGIVYHKSGLVGGNVHGIDICCSGKQAECINKNGTITNSSGTSLCTPWLAGAFALVKESLGYPSNKVVMDYILRKAIKQTDPVLYGKGLFTF